MKKKSRSERVGLTYGRLLVTAVSEKPNHVICKCRCGSENIHVTPYRLEHGTSKSCGCLNIELLKARTKTHGMTKSRTFSSWIRMKNRCNNSNTAGHENYGGRGIGICQRWMKFENFLIDMGERPEGTTLDRIDNNLGYSPENCKWADSKTQVRNRRCTVMLEYMGELKPASEWAEILGITYSSIMSRRRRGQTIACMRKKLGIDAAMQS